MVKVDVSVNLNLKPVMLREKPPSQRHDRGLVQKVGKAQAERGLPPNVGETGGRPKNRSYSSVEVIADSQVLPRDPNLLPASTPVFRVWRAKSRLVVTKSVCAADDSSA